MAHSDGSCSSKCPKYKHNIQWKRAEELQNWTCYYPILQLFSSKMRGWERINGEGQGRGWLKWSVGRKHLAGYFIVCLKEGGRGAKTQTGGELKRAHVDWSEHVPVQCSTNKWETERRRGKTVGRAWMGREKAHSPSLLTRDGACDTMDMYSHGQKFTSACKEHVYHGSLEFQWVFILLWWNGRNTNYFVLKKKTFIKCV